MNGHGTYNYWWNSIRFHWSICLSSGRIRYHQFCSAPKPSKIFILPVKRPKQDFSHFSQSHVQRVQRWFFHNVGKFWELLPSLFTQMWHFRLQLGGRVLLPSKLGKAMRKNTGVRNGLLKLHVSWGFIKVHLNQSFSPQLITVPPSGVTSPHGRHEVTRLFQRCHRVTVRINATMSHYCQLWCGSLFLMLQLSLDGASSLHHLVRRLDDVQVPLLMISAADDPMMTSWVPLKSVRSNEHLILAYTKHGGHMATWDSIRQATFFGGCFYLSTSVP